MTSKEILLMILAFIWVALLVLFITRWMNAPGPVLAQNPGTTEVLVATKDINANQPLLSENVHWEKISQTQLEPEDIQNEPHALESYLGRQVLITVHAKEVLKKNYFAKNQKDRLAQFIRPGMYAMTVELNKNNDENLFITPGDKVDVFLTRALTVGGNTNSQNNEYVTQILLANIRVLAVDNTMSDESNISSKQSDIGQRTLTLEVSSHQAERLSLAIATGSLSFSLHTDLGVDSNPTLMPVSSKSLYPTPKPPILEYHGDKVIYKQD